MARTVNYDEVLFGNEKSNTRSSIERYFDIVTKSDDELVTLYQTQLQSRTFMEGHHITIADLLAFCSFYRIMREWCPEKKFASNHIFRWYNHMQNLNGIKEIWEGDYVVFPVKVDKTLGLSKKELKNIASKERRDQTKALHQQNQENGTKPVLAANSSENKTAKTEEKTEKTEDPKKDNKPQQNNKKEGQPKEKAPKGGKGNGGNAPKPKPGSDEDLFLKFSQLELRIGTIDEVWVHPESEKLYCEKINIGTEVRQIASGLQNHIPKEGMTGKVMVASNLKEKALAGFGSKGMVMCASLKTEDGKSEVIELVRPHDGAQVGDRVYLDGLELEDKALDFPPNSLLGKLFPHLKTDSEGYVCFNGKRMRTKSGLMKASGIKNGTVA